MIYRTGEFSIHRDRYEVFFGGERIPVQPKAFEVLTYLIENRHRVVEKSELLEELWQGAHVGEASIRRCIHLLRGIWQSRSAPNVILTVHGRGYRFGGDVDLEQDAPSSSTFSVPAQECLAG